MVAAASGTAVNPGLVRSSSPMFANAVPAGKVLASGFLELLAEQSATSSKVPLRY
jgi:hypothetical protein